MTPSIAIERHTLAVFLALLVSACAESGPPCVLPAENAHIYLVSRGWHTEIGIPADRLIGPLSSYRRVFPGARTIMFGYGKRTFVTAHADKLSEYILGPVPGPAAIQVTGLSVTPIDAYSRGQVTELALPRNGAASLSRFIWNDLAKTRQGAPQHIGPGPFPGSLFYAAQSQYTLLHTCNSWSVDALAAAQLPISSHDVIFSGQAVARARSVLLGQCRAAANHAP